MTSPTFPYPPDNPADQPPSYPAGRSEPLKRGGRTHLIIGTRSGEIGFYVPNVADWINAIRTVGSTQPT